MTWDEATVLCYEGAAQVILSGETPAWVLTDSEGRSRPPEDVKKLKEGWQFLGEIMRDKAAAVARKNAKEQSDD